LHHSQVAGVPPLEGRSLENVSENLSPVWGLLESEFAEDTEALALNLTLLLGIAARDSEINDLHGQDIHTVMDLPSQAVYISLLQEIAEAGRAASPGNYREALCLTLFDALQYKLLARRPEIATTFEPDEIRELFAVDIKGLMAYKRSIYTKGPALDEMPLQAIRRLKKDVLEVSEDWFIEATKLEADQGMTINIGQFNLEIVHRFCDKAYWQHYCDSISLAEDRGDIEEWNRLKRIGRSYLRWVKDQYAQITYMRELEE
jgi:hypothetical protein